MKSLFNCLLAVGVFGFATVAAKLTGTAAGAYGWHSWAERKLTAILARS